MVFLKDSQGHVGSVLGWPGSALQDPGEDTAAPGVGVGPSWGLSHQATS